MGQAFNLTSRARSPVLIVIARSSVLIVIKVAVCGRYGHSAVRWPDPRRLLLSGDGGKPDICKGRDKCFVHETLHNKNYGLQQTSRAADRSCRSTKPADDQTLSSSAILSRRDRRQPSLVEPLIRDQRRSANYPDDPSSTYLFAPRDALLNTEPPKPKSESFPSAMAAFLSLTGKTSRRAKELVPKGRIFRLEGDEDHRLHDRALTPMGAFCAVRESDIDLLGRRVWNDRRNNSVSRGLAGRPLRPRVESWQGKPVGAIHGDPPLGALYCPCKSSRRLPDFVPEALRPRADRQSDNDGRDARLFQFSKSVASLGLAETVAHVSCAEPGLFDHGKQGHPLRPHRSPVSAVPGRRRGVGGLSKAIRNA